MRTGWLCPSGDFVPCGLYEHIGVVTEHPAFLKAVPEIESLLRDTQHAYESCEQLQAKEGRTHAEWHVYEMACENAKSSIWKLLLDRGFFRVGESGDGIHFEGRPNFINSQWQRCKDYAEGYDKQAIFEPRSSKE